MHSTPMTEHNIVYTQTVQWPVQTRGKCSVCWVISSGQHWVSQSSLKISENSASGKKFWAFQGALKDNN